MLLSAREENVTTDQNEKQQIPISKISAKSNILKKKIHRTTKHSFVHRYISRNSSQFINVNETRTGKRKQVIKTSKVQG